MLKAIEACLSPKKKKADTKKEKNLKDGRGKSGKTGLYGRGNDVC